MSLTTPHNSATMAILQEAEASLISIVAGLLLQPMPQMAEFAPPKTDFPGVLGEMECEVIVLTARASEVLALIHRVDTIVNQLVNGAPNAKS